MLSVSNVAIPDTLACLRQLLRLGAGGLRRGDDASTQGVPRRENRTPDEPGGRAGCVESSDVAAARQAAKGHEAEEQEQERDTAARARARLAATAALFAT